MLSAWDARLSCTGSEFESVHLESRLWMVARVCSSGWWLVWTQLDFQALSRHVPGVCQACAKRVPSVCQACAGRVPKNLNPRWASRRFLPTPEKQLLQYT